MARADRGPLLSSLVLVGLATVATAVLVLIGVQAGKISFNPDKSSGSSRTDNGGTIIGVEPGQDPEPATSSSRASTRPTGAASSRGTSGNETSGNDTDDDDGTGPRRTPGVSRTTAPPTQPQPRPSTTTATARPSATRTTATARPSPSQTTATTRPSNPPPPSPSPTCTATDRSGKCKKQEAQPAESPPSARPSHFPISF